MRLNVGDGKILRVHPDLPAIEILVLALRLDLENIAVAAIFRFRSHQREIVIVASEGRLVPGGIGFLLAGQQLVQNMVKQELRAAFRDDVEGLMSVIVTRADLHGSLFVDHAVVADIVCSDAGKASEIRSSLRIAQQQPGDDIGGWKSNGSGIAIGETNTGDKQ